MRNAIASLRSSACATRPVLRSKPLGRLAVALVVLVMAPRAYSQTQQATVDVDVPFELIAPWFNADHTEIIDQVLLRGTLHVTTRTWQSSPDHIDRFALHANAVDIHGTSDTTGQRYRLNGSFSYDLHDPEVTFNEDGTFNVPMQPFTLRLHMVDPEPARLTQDLVGSTGATGAAVYTPPVTLPCQRITAPDGTPTVSVSCGTTTLSYFLAPNPYLYRVLVGEGDACTPGTLCVVPNGATLFNGYTGGYKPPLFMQAKVNTVNGPYGTGTLAAFTVKWHCKTGTNEQLIPSTSFSGGLFIGSCRPVYSPTLPILVWAEVSFRFYRYLSPSQPKQEVTLIVNEPPFVFHMDQRLTDQPPVVHAISVQAESRATGRCPPGELCELLDGDIIFNQQVGDYNPPLLLRATASDPEGDPIFVEWFCQSGSFFAPITTTFGLASCTPGYIYPDPILIYVRISDGNNVVWSLQRRFFMLEFIH